jgi:YD repeat-containing protein
MKRTLISMTLAIACSGWLKAKTATDLNEGPTITRDPAVNPTLPFEVTFWGRPNFYYFVLQTSDLTNDWAYHDFAVKGVAGTGGLGEVEGFRFDSSASSLFFRIQFFDPSSNDPVLLADFDGDFVSNKAELDQGTDVFDLVFSDPDLLADEWELFFFGDLSQGDTDNDDTDYTNNLEESQLGLDPSADEKGLALTYTYDDLGRLTAVSGNTTAVSYTLDEEGNITLTD